MKITSFFSENLDICISFVTVRGFEALTHAPVLKGERLGGACAEESAGSLPL